MDRRARVRRSVKYNGAFLKGDGEMDEDVKGQRKSNKG